MKNQVIINYKRRRSKKFSAGMSLIELLLGISLLLVLAGIYFASLITAKTVWQSSIAQAANSQEATIFFIQLSRELQGTDPESITYTGNENGVNGFSFLSAENSSGEVVTGITGEKLWQKHILYCIPFGSTNLIKKEIPLNSNYLLGIQTEIPILTSSEIMSMCDGNGRILTKAVRSFNLKKGDGTSLLSGFSEDNTTPLILTGNSRQINIYLSLERKAKHGAIDRLSRSVTVFVRNPEKLETN